MKRGLLWKAVVCLLVLSGASSAQISSAHTLVGILEEVPGVYAGENSHFGVRVAFEQNFGGWHAFQFECGNPGCLVSVTEKYPRETRWTVSSNGRILGTVLARTPTDFAFYSHVGIQNVADGEKVPTVGNRSTDYSGFLESPVQRPLLATAGAPKLGPAHGGWHLSLVDPRDAKRVWPLFQQVVPLIDDCRLDARGEYIPSEGRAPRLIEFEIATRWANRAGDALLYAHIRQDAFKECDGPMSHRSAYWYYRQSDGAIRLLPGQDTFAADAT